MKDLPAHVDGDLLGEVAACDCGRNLGDIANLRRQVRRHRVHIVGQVLPCARYARHRGLSAKPALGADLAGHARHLRSEGVELVHHRVDGVLELEDFPFHIHGDLAAQVAACDRCGDFRNVAHLRRQVRGQKIHIVSEVFPRARHAGDNRLATEAPFGADFPRHACDLGCERAKLVHHRIDGFLQLKDFTAHIDGDLLGQVAMRDRNRDLGNITNLSREV